MNMVLLPSSDNVASHQQKRRLWHSSSICRDDCSSLWPLEMWPLGLEPSLDAPRMWGGSTSIPIELCRACHEGFCVHMNNLHFSVPALCPCLFTGSLSPSTVLGWLCPLGRVNWETLILRGAVRGSVGGRCDPFTHMYEPTSKQSPSTIYAHSPFPKTASWSSYEEMGYDEAGTELDSSVVAGALSWEEAFPNSFFFDRTPQTHSQIMGYWSFGFST